MGRTKKSLDKPGEPNAGEASQAGRQGGGPAETSPGGSNAAPALALGQTGGMVLAFEVAGQRYGLPLDSVVQIVGMVAITRLPKVPQVVVGVVDFMGQVIPIVDARRRLRQPVQPYTLDTPIIVSRLNGRTMGLVVDAVIGVRPLRPEQLQAPDQILTQDLALQVHHVIGVARLEDGLVIVLDPDTFLSLAEQESLEETLPSRQPGSGSE